MNRIFDKALWRWFFTSLFFGEFIECYFQKKPRHIWSFGPEVVLDEFNQQKYIYVSLNLIKWKASLTVKYFDPWWFERLT